jgi:hypothetical protein
MKNPMPLNESGPHPTRNMSVKNVRVLLRSPHMTAPRVKVLWLQRVQNVMRVSGYLGDDNAEIRAAHFHIYSSYVREELTLRIRAGLPVTDRKFRRFLVPKP